MRISPVTEEEVTAAKQGGWWHDEYVRNRDVSPAVRAVSAPIATVNLQLPDNSVVAVPGSNKDTPRSLLGRLESIRSDVHAEEHQLAYGGQALNSQTPVEQQNVPDETLLNVNRLPAIVASLPEGSHTIPSADLELAIEEPASIPADIPYKAGVRRIRPSSVQPPVSSDSALPDTGPLSSSKQRIPVGASVEAVPTPTFYVVEPVRSEKLPFYCSPSTTVSAFKGLVAERTGIATAAQLLSYNRAAVAEGNTLEQAGVPVGATMNLEKLAGVYVKLPDGGTAALDLDPTATGAAVRKAAGTAAGLKPEQLACSMEGQPLRLTRPLAEAGAKWGVVVECVAAPSLQVKEKASGKIHSLFVPLSNDVHSAKRELEGPVGLAAEQQELSFNGRALDDTKSFSEEGIPDGAELLLDRKPDVMLRLLDGTFEPLMLDGLQTKFSDVVDAASELTGFGHADFYLAHNGKELPSEGSLESADIPLGETFVVVPLKPLADVARELTGLRVATDGQIIELPHLSTKDLPSTVLLAINKGNDGTSLYYEDQRLVPNQPLNEQGVPEHSLLDAYSASFLRRLYRVMVIYLAILFLLGMMAQWLIRLITYRVAKTQDIFIRQFMESVFRAVSIIAIVIMVVEVLLNVDIFEFKLEERIFGEFEGETSNHLRITFRKMMEKTQFFLATYLVMVLALAGIVWRNNEWLSRMDRTPVAELLDKSPQSAEVTFATLRTDFALSVGVMGIRGVDPEFYNFYEYVRSCLLVAAEEFVRLPNTCLFLGFLSCIWLMPLHSLEETTRMWLTLGMTAVPTLLLLLLWLRCIVIKRYLAARDPKGYIELATPAIEDPDKGEQLRDIPEGPQYLTMNFQRQTHAPTAVVRWVYQTRYPNRHEVLFWLWRAGPSLLFRLFEVTFFIALLCGGEGIYAINRSWALWARRYGRWPMLGYWLLLLLPLTFLPWVMWDLIVATRTGGLVDQHVLNQVWRLQRSETIRRVARLIDLLRIEASLWEIERAGPQFMARLRQTSLNVSEAVAAQNKRLWDELDDDEDGQINLPQLFRFLNRKGLNIDTENEAENWFRVFDADNSGGIEFEEFCCVVSIAKQLTGQPMDAKNVTTLLTDKFKFDMEDNRVITPETVSAKLLRSMGLLREWNMNHVIHLLDMIQSRTAAIGRRAMKVEEFVQGLKLLEQETLGTLTEAIDELSLRKRE